METSQATITIYDEKSFEDRIPFNESIHFDDPTILLLSEGEVTIERGSQKFVLKNNMLAFFSPRAVYTVRPFSNNSKFLVLTFKRSYASRYTTIFNRHNLYNIFYLGFPNSLQVSKEDFNQLWDLVTICAGHPEKEDDDIYTQKFQIHIFSAIIFLSATFIEQYSKQGTGTVNRKEEITARFFRDMSEYYNETQRPKRDLRSYALKQNISVKHLSETVKEVTGITAGEYLERALTNEARILVATTQKTLSEIALELHFSDQYAFSKFFKKNIGKSPSELRRIS